MGRVCSEPGCPMLATDSNRCDAHKRKPWAKDTRRRGTSGWDWQRTVARILKRDHHVCHWCKGTATTADHVIAVADGGSDDDSNLVAACSTCNTRRMRELIAARRNDMAPPLRANQNLLGDRRGRAKTVRTG